MTRRSVWRWSWRILAGVVVAAVGIPAVTAVHVWWVARHDQRVRSDAIVVLGASQFDGRPSSVFEARLDHARKLYEQGVASYVITVGGNRPGDRFTEGSAGRDWLVRHGVPATHTIKVEEGADTLASLRAVHQVFMAHGWKRAVIVTDPWHSLRSRTMADDVGIRAETSPTRAGPAVRKRGTEFRYIARETMSYLYYQVFHRSPDRGLRAV